MYKPLPSPLFQWQYHHELTGLCCSLLNVPLIQRIQSNTQQSDTKRAVLSQLHRHPLC